LSRFRVKRRYCRVKRRGITGWIGLVGISTLLLVCGLPTSVVAAPAAVTEPGEAGSTLQAVQACQQVVAAPVHGAEAVDLLGPDLGNVASDNGLSVATLHDRLLADPTLWVDPCGRLFYVDPTLAVDSAPAAPEAMPFPVDQTFLLHSQPGANRVIYLDFNGELISGTAWNTSYNGGSPFTAPAYDTDGSSGTFSSAEQTVIQSVWQRVAEDYAPFSVDVTTEDPGLAAIDRSASSDAVYGTRALITNDSLIQSQCGCGGIAYVGVFDEIAPSHQTYEPAFVFQRSLAGGTVAKYLAEAVSHEVGHNLGLSHDGTASVGYYAGHGSWAPIMGVGYSMPIVQWSKGEYTGANNTQDDFAVIQSNGAPAQADDYPDTRAAAASLGTGASASASGLIGTRTDVDWFSFAGSGPTSVTVTTATVSPDLDVQLRLYDSTGALLASADPAAATVSQDVASGLGASISITLPSAGTYFVSVEGVGFANPLSTGYSDYASVGEYSLSVATGSVPPAVTSVSPASGSEDGGTTATITGTGFAGATAVSFGGTAAASFTVSSDTQISAVSPAGTGIVDITVTSPLGASVTSSADEFTFVPDASGATYFSLTPVRLLDTRVGTGLSGTFTSGLPRTFAVTGQGGVPANAVAVTGNLTVTAQTFIGYVALTPEPTASPTTSTLNFPVGDNRGNGLTVALGTGGTLSAVYVTAAAGQTADLIFDVTGYFVP
jgi:hypothetical protein